jgi:hypothetical protein
MGARYRRTCNKGFSRTVCGRVSVDACLGARLVCGSAGALCREIALCGTRDRAPRHLLLGTGSASGERRCMRPPPVQEVVWRCWLHAAVFSGAVLPFLHRGRFRNVTSGARDPAREQEQGCKMEHAPWG